MSIAPITSSVDQATQISDLLHAAPARHTAPSQLKGAALRNAAPAEQRQAVAAQFEAILVRQMLGKTMTSMFGGAEGGVSGSIYGDMLAEKFAEQLTAGPGLGLGRMLVRQLTPKGETSAPVAADQPTEIQ